MANPYEGMDFSDEQLRGIIWRNDSDAAIEEATMAYRGAVGAMRDLECGERRFLPGTSLNPQEIIRIKLESITVIKQLAEDDKQVNESLYGKTYP